MRSNIRICEVCGRKVNRKIKICPWCGRLMMRNFHKFNGSELIVQDMEVETNTPRIAMSKVGFNRISEESEVV